MCHTDDAEPPRAPGAAGRADTAAIHLTSADGTRFMAYRAVPAERRGPAVVVLPDMRGLHGFYQSFARQLAGRGYEAVVIDYYGRVLPDGPRDGPAEQMMPLVTALDPRQVAQDVRAAVDLLRAEGARDVFALGFCVGGSHAWNQSAFDPSLAGCVGFYGRPDDCRPRLAEMRIPLLLLGAGADFMSSPEDFRAFDGELTAAGVEHTAVLYDGLPHAFFDQAAEQFQEQCADAWHRVLHFLEEHRTDEHATAGSR